MQAFTSQDNKVTYPQLEQLRGNIRTNAAHTNNNDNNNSNSFSTEKMQLLAIRTKNTYCNKIAMQGDKGERIRFTPKQMYLNGTRCTFLETDRQEEKLEK
jgi:hypothetical protein